MILAIQTYSNEYNHWFLGEKQRTYQIGSARKLLQRKPGHLEKVSLKVRSVKTDLAFRERKAAAAAANTGLLRGL